jgi:hypothetical protein
MELTPSHPHDLTYETSYWVAVIMIGSMSVIMYVGGLFGRRYGDRLESLEMRRNGIRFVWFILGFAQPQPLYPLQAALPGPA